MIGETPLRRHPVVLVLPRDHSKQQARFGTRLIERRTPVTAFDHAGPMVESQAAFRTTVRPMTRQALAFDDRPCFRFEERGPADDVLVLGECNGIEAADRQGRGQRRDHRAHRERTNSRSSVLHDPQGKSSGTSNRPRREHHHDSRDTAVNSTSLDPCSVRKKTG